MLVYGMVLLWLPKVVMHLAHLGVFVIFVMLWQRTRNVGFGLLAILALVTTAVSLGLPYVLGSLPMVNIAAMLNWLWAVIGIVDLLAMVSVWAFIKSRIPPVTGTAP